MRENPDQNNSEYGLFSRSAGLKTNISTSEIAEIVSMKWVTIAFLGLNPFIWYTILWKYYISALCSIELILWHKFLPVIKKIN